MCVCVCGVEWGTQYLTTEATLTSEVSGGETLKCVTASCWCFRGDGTLSFADYAPGLLQHRQEEVEASDVMAGRVSNLVGQP